MKPIRIYWGGDLFDHKDLTGNLLLADAVKKVSAGRYLPVLPQESEEDNERALNIRDCDYDLLLSCDVMLANFDGPDLDSGTVAEFLFARMLDYPAVLLRTDFRKSGESAASPDPWNLMCSGFPRTKSRIIHAMELMHEAKMRNPDWIGCYHTSIAELLVQDLDEVCATASVFSPEELPLIYRNVIRAAGGNLPRIWPEEKIREKLKSNQ